MHWNSADVTTFISMVVNAQLRLCNWLERRNWASFHVLLNLVHDTRIISGFDVHCCSSYSLTTSSSSALSYVRTTPSKAVDCCWSEPKRSGLRSRKRAAKLCSPRILWVFRIRTRNRRCGTRATHSNAGMHCCDQSVYTACLTTTCAPPAGRTPNGGASYTTGLSRRNCNWILARKVII